MWVITLIALTILGGISISTLIYKRWLGRFYLSLIMGLILTGLNLGLQNWGGICDLWYLIDGSVYIGFFPLELTIITFWIGFHLSLIFPFDAELISEKELPMQACLILLTCFMGVLFESTLIPLGYIFYTTKWNSIFILFSYAVILTIWAIIHHFVGKKFILSKNTGYIISKNEK